MVTHAMKGQFNPCKLYPNSGTAREKQIFFSHGSRYLMFRIFCPRSHGFSPADGILTHPTFVL